MSLLERFQAGSELDSHGEFTLDESKARQKMARFQLVTTEEFLMLVVQAVVAAHCSALEIALQESRVRVVAREALLDHESLGSIESFLFDSQPENVAYHLLAVAANAIEPACLGSPLLAMVDEDFHFELQLAHELPALANLVRQRLRYLPCPLVLDGEALATEPLNGQARITLKEEGPSHLVLVRYGVQVMSRQLSRPIENSAVAPADSVQLDASFSHVVENDAYHAVLTELAMLANEKLAERARAFQAEGEDLSYLLAHLQADHPDPAGAALRACPFFPLADRPGFTSLEEMLQRFSTQGRVLTSMRNYNLQLPSPVVRLDNLRLRQALEGKLPAKALQDAHQEYLEEEAANANRRRWEASPRPTELPPGNYLCRAQVGGSGWQAEIGYLAAPGGAARVDVLYQGKLLANEALGNVPPGATAVLNLPKAEVDRSWSRLGGRHYRSVLKELKDKLVEQFASLAITEVEQLYPELRDYLLKELAGKRPPAVARGAPLFPLVEGGRPLSLDQVAAQAWQQGPSDARTVHFGDPMPALKSFPVPVALPSPMLLYSHSHYQAIVAQLGKAVVRDERALQRRLETISGQLSRPRAAVLETEEKVLRRKGFEHGPARGQLGLLASPGDKLSYTFLFHGAEVETGSAPGARVFRAIAVVEAPQLKPAPRWSEFERDEQHAALLQALRAEALALEQELLADLGSVVPELRIKLLRAYSPPKETYWTTPLFTTTSYNTLASFEQLANEIRQSGNLLRGEPGVLVPGRVALLRPSKEIATFLTDTLGAFSWEEASVALRLHLQARQFEQKPVHQVISVPGLFPVRVPLPQGRGEVVLQSSSNPKPAQVDCYVRGRFVCSKARFIEKPFLAAVESDTFTLSSDYGDVTVPEQVQTMLLEVCSEAMLLAAASRQAGVVEQAWEYFSRAEMAASPYRARFIERTSLPGFDGTPIPLTGLLEGKISGYVSPDFRTSVQPEGLVLRLSSAQARSLSAFLSRRLDSLEAALEAEEEYRRVLKELPTQLDPALFSRTFEQGALKAQIAVGQPRATVGLDDQGQPVGRLDDLRLPVQAIVWGARPAAKKRHEAKAELPAKAYQQLAEWAESLCLDWVKERADDPELVLTLLLLSLREIGSRRSRPLSEMADLLWDMPLFTRVDKTKVSGSALAATFSESKEPIAISSSTFRVPGSVIVLEEGSEEHQILVGALGQRGVNWYEAPPLIDPAEVRKSVKRLVSWGLAPVRETVSTLSRVWEELKPDEKEPPKEKKEAKNEAPKTRDPREVLVVALKEDVRNLLGRDHYRKSDKMFTALDFGSWPLGPPVYRPRGKGHFRLNLMHPAIRWLLSEGDEPRKKREARVMLLVHWVGLVNIASEELRDAHEDEFLVRLAEQMTRTFSSS